MPVLFSSSAKKTLDRQECLSYWNARRTRFASPLRGSDEFILLVMLTQGFRPGLWLYAAPTGLVVCRVPHTPSLRVGFVFSHVETNNHNGKENPHT